MHVPELSLSAGPIGTAWETFRWLSRGPGPVCVDGRLFGAPIPDRPVPLDEVQRLLLVPGCPRPVWDQVWRHVILRARAEGPVWMMAAIGLALPMLTRIGRALTDRLVEGRYEVHAAVLAGAAEAVAQIDIDRPGIVARLRWWAHRAGSRALRDHLGAPLPGGQWHSAPPVLPWGHPDLVLGRAVIAGVLTSQQADLIGRTRMEATSLAEWALAHEMPYGRAQRARHRAELRLADWLAEQGELTGTAHADDPTWVLATDRLALVPSERRASRSARRPGRGLRRRGGTVPAPGTPATRRGADADEADPADGAGGRR